MANTVSNADKKKKYKARFTYDSLCMKCIADVFPKTKDLYGITIRYAQCPRCSIKDFLIPWSDLENVKLLD